MSGHSKGDNIVLESLDISKVCKNITSSLAQFERNQINENP